MTDEDLDGDGANDTWAQAILFDAAFGHARDGSACVGYTLINDGRVKCHVCGWALSARIEDRDGRFAFAALATIGQAIGTVEVLLEGDTAIR